jgi:putative SOS response-associated peptidase YedK
VGKESEPYLFRRPDHGPFAFAALHETWHSPDGSEIDTVALVNSHANGLMAAVHHRCPIILDPRDHDLWLDPGAEPRQIDAMLKPPPDEMLEMVRIGKTVNKVANDGPEVQALFEAAPEPPAPAPPPAPDDAGLGPARQEDAATPPAAKRRRADPERQGSLF